MSGTAASKGTHLEKDRGQALHKHPFHRARHTSGSPVRGPLAALCHAPHNPLHTSASHPQNFLAVSWGHEDLPNL